MYSWAASRAAIESQPSSSCAIRKTLKSFDWSCFLPTVLPPSFSSLSLLHQSSLLILLQQIRVTQFSQALLPLQIAVLEGPAKADLTELPQERGTDLFCLVCLWMQFFVSRAVLAPVSVSQLAHAVCLLQIRPSLSLQLKPSTLTLQCVPRDDG